MCILNVKVYTNAHTYKLIDKDNIRQVYILMTESTEQKSSLSKMGVELIAIQTILWHLLNADKNIIYEDKEMRESKDLLNVDGSVTQRYQEESIKIV